MPNTKDKTKLEGKVEKGDGANKETDSNPDKNNQQAVSKTEVVAKAGKRSQKGLAESAEKQAKVLRQTAGATSENLEEKPKTKIVKPPRSKLERSGKKYRQAAESFDRTKGYSLNEAVVLAKKTNTAKFNASVELHINLNVDPKIAEQNIRDNVVLPGGSGKLVRVAVFAEPEKLPEARKAGAELALGDELLQLLDKGELNFDILIATPGFMAKLGKYAKLLGPKGLMPNPKSGTVTADVARAVSEAKAGKVEYRVDANGIIHLAVGKVDFDDEKLLSNIEAVLKSVRSNKPASIKGVFVKNAYLTTTMGPSIKLSL